MIKRTTVGTDKQDAMKEPWVGRGGGKENKNNSRGREEEQEKRSRQDIKESLEFLNGH